jgi:hypothetical protein
MFSMKLPLKLVNFGIRERIIMICAYWSWLGKAYTTYISTGAVYMQ